MTVADFFDALETKAMVNIIKDKSTILEIKNVGTVADKLSDELAGSTIETIDIVGSTTVSVTIAGTP